MTEPYNIVYFRPNHRESSANYRERIIFDRSEFVYFFTPFVRADADIKLITLSALTSYVPVSLEYRDADSNQRIANPGTMHMLIARNLDHMSRSGVERFEGSRIAKTLRTLQISNVKIETLVLFGGGLKDQHAIKAIRDAYKYEGSSIKDILMFPDIQQNEIEYLVEQRAKPWLTDQYRQLLTPPTQYCVTTDGVTVWADPIHG